MFDRIKRHLLISYLIILASILIAFAIAVRVVFVHSLTEQIIEKLTALGQGAATNAEYEHGKISVENDFNEQNLIAQGQALQWFDRKGNLINQQGKNVLNTPFVKSKSIIVQKDKSNIGVTLTIISNDNNKLVGYVRASQSLVELNQTLNKLNLGLSGGIGIALIMSGIGGIILTRQAMRPIEESFQRLKQFTADASHELRSPLMAIKSNTDVALKYPEGMREKDAEKFQAIVSATNQMTRLTEDLLFLARTDKIPHRGIGLVNLTSILQNLEQLYQPQAIAKQINLKISCNSNLLLPGDSIQLTRLFTNLIQNALHYTSSGGSVEITATRVSSYIVVNVKDTGVGIAPEHLSKVFERLWRGEESRSYWDGGSGLGLSIAQAIAHNHSGLITVKSQLGVGSCFTVRLPI